MKNNFHGLFSSYRLKVLLKICPQEIVRFFGIVLEITA